MSSTLRNGLLITFAVVVVGAGAFVVTRRNAAAQSSTTSDASQTSSVTLPVGMDSATLVAANGQTGAGVATRQVVDGIFVHGVTAVVADPPAGQFYAGWLVSGNDIVHAVYTGKFVKQADSYSLDYSSPIDYREYSEVLVTLQTAENQAPQTTILSGTFQTTN